MYVKKVLALLIAGALCMATFGCNQQQEQKQTEEGKQYRVAMVANAPIADGGWNSACYEGMQKAAQEHGFETSFTEKVQQTDYVSVFTEYANSAPRLIGQRVSIG